VASKLFAPVRRLVSDDLPAMMARSIEAPVELDCFPDSVVGILFLLLRFPEAREQLRASTRGCRKPCGWNCPETGSSIAGIIVLVGTIASGVAKEREVLHIEGMR